VYLHVGWLGFVGRPNPPRSELGATLEHSIPNVVVNVGKENVPHILNISIPSIDTDYAVMLLSEAGFAVSTKSACETDADGSRAVFALTGDQERSRSTLRISWGPSTKDFELKSFATALIRTVKFLEQNGIG
jgi:cysteine desulfurase